MRGTRRGKWSANEWAATEIDCQADLYSQTRLVAAKVVLDLLQEGEYRDELQDDQVQAAISATRRIIREETR